MEDNNSKPNVTTPNAPMTNEVGKQLTKALDLMRTEMIARHMGNYRAGQPNNNNDGDAVDDKQLNDTLDSVRPNRPEYYPDLDKVYGHIYLDLTEII